MRLYIAPVLSSLYLMELKMCFSETSFIVNVIASVILSVIISVIDSAIVSAIVSTSGLLFYCDCYSIVPLLACC